MRTLRSSSPIRFAESRVRRLPLLRRLSLTVVILTLISVCPSKELMAQARTANSKRKIAGVVTDETGKRLPSVLLTLQTIDGRMVAHGISDNHGDFTFSYPHADDFLIVANKRGFMTAASEIAESKTTTVRIILEAEQIEE